MTTVLIDAGHGGHSAAGKSSPFGVRGAGGTLEKDVTLSLARAVAGHFGEGALLTRDRDENLSLEDRARLAKERGARVFVSLHVNSGAVGERGPGTFVHARAGAPSRLLAECIQTRLERHAGATATGAIRRAPLAVLEPNRLPPDAAACLVEVDFLSDLSFEQRLRDAASVDALGREIALALREHLAGESGHAHGPATVMGLGTGPALGEGLAPVALWRPPYLHPPLAIAQSVTLTENAIAALDAAGSATPVTADRTLETLQRHAVARANELWQRRVNEANAAEMAQLARDCGWGNDINKDGGGTWDWCGFFCAAALFHAGLHPNLRRGLYHTQNVQDLFRYRYGHRVHRWLHDDTTRTWKTVEDYHRERGLLRTWKTNAELTAAGHAALDLRPGDVVLIDHTADGSADHIVLVDSYDAASGMLVTVEGNASGQLPPSASGPASAPRDAVTKNRRDLSQAAQLRKIFGVGRPSLVDFETHTYAAPSQTARPAPLAVSSQDAQSLSLLGDVIDVVATPGIRVAFEGVVATNKLAATAITVPQRFVDKLREYAAQAPDDGRKLLAGLNRNPTFYQGGWILSVQTGAVAMTLDTAVFCRELEIGTYIHELVHVWQYDRLGVSAFLVSYFGLSAAEIARRFANRLPLDPMRSSPHEEEAYQLERRFMTWLSAHP